MIPRTTILPKLIESHKSALILGPRGTGKSYYINELLGSHKNSMKIDLLSQINYQKYLKNPELLYKEVEFALTEQKAHFLIFIDEIQLIPSLLNEVQRLYLAFNEKCSFLLTGSSARKLKKADVNLLAGRALHVPFYSLNFSEIDFLRNFDHVLQFGCLPEVFLEKEVELKIHHLKTYTHIYLKEEILQESLVRNIEGFGRFLEIAAFENGLVLNFSKIGKQAGIKGQTVKEYFQILEDTLLAKRVPAWTYSQRKQLQTAPKYYLFDNGVINSLTGELSTELKSSSYRYGRLFENLVINEIIKYNSLKKYDYNFYHYRTNHGKEIDLIIQKNIHSPPIAVEIKSSTNPTASDVNSLEHILEDWPQAKLMTLCNCQHPYKDKKIDFYPFLEGIPKIFDYA